MSHRFAIVGCGRIAQRHAECIVNSGSLVGVCDVLKEKAELLALRYGAKAYSSMENMLNEVVADVVCICTPNGLHAQQSIMALSRGSHVLCEKPMAISWADGIKMCEAAAKFGKKLFVVKQNRFNPPVILLKNLLETGKLGRVHGFQVNCFWNRPTTYYQSNWHGTLSQDGGILFTQFSHFIDLIWWLFGSMEEAKGWRSNDLHKDCIEFEDNGVTTIKMRNGVTGTLHYSINSFKKNMEGSITVFGEKGTVKIGGEYLNQLEYFEVEGEKLPDLPIGASANNYGLYKGSMSNHDKVYKELVKALHLKSNSIVEATEALNTIDIIEKIYSCTPLVLSQLSKL